MNPSTLFQSILSGYSLNPYGIHGVPHWARVYETGERLAFKTGADVEIVRLFALFHDCRRRNDSIDQGHGRRGAEFAFSLRGTLIDLDPARFDLLYYACAHHTDGETEADVTIQTCWDADRLDLGRVGIAPKAKFLCTSAAKELDLMQWADQRAVNEIESPLVGQWMAEKAG